MFKDYSEYKSYLKADIDRNFTENKLKFRFKLLNSKYKFIILFRTAQYFYNRNKIVGKIIKKLYEIQSEKLLVDLPIETKVGEGIYFPHLQGIVINKNVIIGKNCTILQQVTIGNNLFKGLNNLAILGNNVQIMAGAKIIGPVKIGENVIIGANSVVTKDIEKNLIVAGVPAKVLKKLN